MFGRSDGILNPAGVQFESAEIYGLLLREFAAEIEDGVCVGRKKEGGNEDVALFVVLPPTWLARHPDGCEELEERIKKAIASGLSLRHVPSWIVRCPEVPGTGNGKKVEVVVKQIVSGIERKVGASVANAWCLEFFREWARNN